MSLPTAILKTIRDSLDKADTAYKALEETISDARRAGIDIKDMEAKASELRQQIARMRAVYGA